MRFSFLFLALSSFTPSWLSAKPPELCLAPPPTEFIQVQRAKSQVALQTAITRYSREDGVHVDLIGAVHIADEAYYRQLNKRFTTYPVLLFEMIGGENLGKGRKLERNKNKPAGALGLINSAFGAMQSALDLSNQQEEIDYSAENFVHADLTVKEFQDLQAQRKQSLLGFAIKQAMQPQKGSQPSSFKLLMALFSRNSNQLKLQVVDTLGEGDNQVRAIAGENVIISDRNAKCIKVMQEQIKLGKKSIGIFYGAAHYPDMEKRLIALNFIKRKQLWLDAWVIPTKQQQQQP